MAKDVKIIIGLAACLAVGLLMNILSCALYQNAYPILVVVAYFLAPFPNLICGRHEDHSFSGDGGSGIKDLGFFLTGFLVISGFGIPAVLAHSKIIPIEAMALALAGGLVVYATILVYLHFFHKHEDDSF
eukprot:TRINITY_DN773_c0_g2_i1.p1 TRINITY_DN773_c0_g2~~TRINITY_DN773_c0_g2_i1.p1  ORF type:complete len:130 (-),score=33.44 TRINITY_DN773_c0_g2_i1:126-515(-)